MYYEIMLVVSYIYVVEVTWRMSLKKFESERNYLHLCPIFNASLCCYLLLLFFLFLFFLKNTVLLAAVSLIFFFQWNSHGYDVAKWFGAKFTHISPVWLQIKRKPGGAFVMEGGHDIDKSMYTYPLLFLLFFCCTFSPCVCVKMCCLYMQLAFWEIRTKPKKVRRS